MKILQKVLLMFVVLSGGIFLFFYVIVFCTPCIKFDDEVNLILNTEVDICSPFNSCERCSVDKILPDGLFVERDCRLRGFTKSVFKPQPFVLKCYVNDMVIDEKSFIIGVYKKLENIGNIRTLQDNIIRNVWEYSDVNQGNNYWNINFDDKENWIENNSFPPKSSVTRYYRNIFEILKIEESGPPLMRITFDDGIMIYINGKEIYRRNLPSGEIESTTISNKKEVRMEEISIPLTAIQEGKNCIGIEIHSSSSTPSNEADSFSVSITLTDPITSTIQISSAGIIESSYKSASGRDILEVVNLDNIYSTNNGYVNYHLVDTDPSEHVESEWFPFNITYIFKDNKAHYFNQFSISGCSNNPYTHPKHIRIYGATDSDNPNWDFLYENKDLNLIEFDINIPDMCKSVFKCNLPVEKSYEIYKMEIIKINNFADVWGGYIQFKLFVVNIEKLPICERDESTFSLVYGGGISVKECGKGYMKRMCIYDSESGTAKWSNEIDKTDCFKGDIYLSTYPKVVISHEFEEEILSISPESEYITKNGRMLILNSSVEIVEHIEIKLSDLSVNNVYVSVVRNVEKCIYGVDYIRIYPIEIELELICDHKPSFLSVKNLPNGLNVDENGVISGMINESQESEEYTTIITYIIDKKYVMKLSWYKKEKEMTRGLEFINFAESSQDSLSESLFHNTELKSIWNKFENGTYKVQDKKLINSFDMDISSSRGSCKKSWWNPCQNGIARMRGYVKINVDGRYTFYGESTQLKFALRNYEEELYNTNGKNVEGSYSSELKKGYYIIGYLSYYGGGSNSFESSIKKSGSEKEDLDKRVFSGGFLLSHLSYNILFVESSKNEKILLKPSYKGIVSEWEMSPKIAGLNIRADGVIEGTISECENDYYNVVVKSVSEIDISPTSTELQVHCFDKSYSKVFQNGLIVKYSVLDPFDIEEFNDISKIENKYLILERIEENIYHNENEEIWNNLPSELCYSFLAEYEGYIHIDSSMSGEMIISLECYDYCLLRISEMKIECIGSGYHKESISMNLNEGNYEMEIMYVKGNKNKTKLLKIYYNKNGIDEKEIPESCYFYNAKYPFIYKILKAKYYEDISMSIDSPFKSKTFTKDISNVKYSINPFLPSGLLLNENDGSIKGKSKIVDENRNYTVKIKLRDGSDYYSLLSFSILPKIEPIIEYSSYVINEKIGENITIIPTRSECDYINSVGLPAGVKIYKNGTIAGIIKFEFEKDIEIDCFTYRNQSIKIHLRISDGSLKPTTIIPTTIKPTTIKPTVNPTTVKPTTQSPTTIKPTIKPTVNPTTVKPTTVKPTSELPTTIKPTTIKPTGNEPTTTEIPNTDIPTEIQTSEIDITTINPSDKMIESSFYIRLQINSFTDDDIIIIKESIIEILYKQEIKMNKVTIEMMKRRMRILSEFNMKVIIKTKESEFSKTSSVIKYLIENKNELEDEIKKRCDKDSDLYNSKIELLIDNNDSSSSNKDESKNNNNNLYLILLISVGCVTVILFIIILCLIINRKNVKRSTMNKPKKENVEIEMSNMNNNNNNNNQKIPQISKNVEEKVILPPSDRVMLPASTERVILPSSKEKHNPNENNNGNKVRI